MEVLHASTPGARVRVMRAAYHSSSGPGVPASSYMLHSSRRVISSGFNILESPTFPSKPLEISSTPLESSPESNNETENYKVTEPDDLDISEPSKWRGTTGGNSIRMPSEESSSTDNASIIDLDPKLNHKGLYRKYSYDSENSDIHSLKRSSARASPLLDAPVALSTLKYKSLLNSSNDWNNRRKSYSFEDTSPLNEIMVQSNDTLAMESSTDSGICKSSEIVNDYPEDTHKRKDVGRENRFNHRDGSADNWQFKNKPTSFYKGPKIKSYKEHDIVFEEPNENNIALQSTGKVTITVPITIEGADDDDKNKQIHANDDADRKVKRVGFCKTELHFAAESGRVNIIATDEKPPPSNDFRKRRSAFVPINDKFEKPITLFGDRNDVSEMIKSDEYGICDVSETVEFDENTAATKSILKNKIPKPKPYLLGENMAFGDIQDVRGDQSRDRSVSQGVSLVNKELETQRISHHKEAVHTFGNEANKGFMDSLRTINKGSSNNTSSNIEKHSPGDRFYLHGEARTNNESIRHKLSALQMSPVPKPKTRQLRESDLMFFGIDNNHNSYNNKKNTKQKITRIKSDFVNDSFESVRLIKQISSSAQNSEADSDDFPDYQNVPLENNFAPIPVPRSRVKYKKPDDEVMALKPITEQLYDCSSKPTQETRRSRSRKQEEFTNITSRSRSEPAKQHRRDNTLHKYSKQDHITERCKGYTDVKVKNKIDDIEKQNPRTDADDNVPLYANLQAKGNKKEVNCYVRPRTRDVVAKTNHETNRSIHERRHSFNKSIDKDSGTLEKKQNTKKNNRIQRTEKLSTPDNTNSINKIKNHEHQKNLSINGSIKNSSRKKEYNILSAQRSNRDNDPMNRTENCDIKDSKVLKNEDDERKEIRQNSKDRNVNATAYRKSNKNSEQNSTEYRTHSKESRPVNKESGEKGTSSNSRRTSRRSEYVIKYDDKNGTVSSISKVRAGHSTSRQKHASKDRTRDNSKDTKIKSKNLEKSDLLQLPDHRIVNGRKEDRKWNTKVHVQRSCQLL